MRRFEWIEKNEAKFWEIGHYDDLVWTRTGKIGSKPKEKQTEHRDDMAAEVDFDKQIHTKRRQGWVEVEEPSDPPAPFEERAMELRPLDGSEPVVFDGPAMKYLLWRMVEVDLFDRHRPADDLSRWEYRACRQLGLDENPAPGSPEHASWRERVVELSARDRAARMKNDLIAAFKWREGSHWIVTPDECVLIAREAANRRPKRRKDKPEQAKWVKAWVDFHNRMQRIGYEAIPVV
jgi:predicted DNA-binding WGR domain protein